MGNHRESYVLNQIIDLLKEEDFFEGKSDEAIERFCGKIVNIASFGCSPGDIFAGHDDLRYCCSCFKVVKHFYPEYGGCLECELSGTEDLIKSYEKQYGSKEYFEDPEKEYHISENATYRSWVSAEQDLIRVQELMNAEKNKMTANITITLQEEKEQAKKVGLEQGEKRKALEVANNLLKMGMDIEAIMKATGLSKEEIEELR